MSKDNDLKNTKQAIEHEFKSTKESRLFRKFQKKWKESFPNICGLPLLLFFWLKWAGYLAVAGLNLLAQISDRISPYGV